MQSQGIIYEFESCAWRVTDVPQENLVRIEPVSSSRKHSWPRKLGLALIALALGGLVGPLVPETRLETHFYLSQAQTKLALAGKTDKPLPPAVPIVFNPLVNSDGTIINPVNKDFSLIIPKIGVNALVIPSVNPADPQAYEEALKHGVAHASTSFLPNQNGTVYLFSHSTNYDWFVKDLNAVFYLLKNLDTGDLIVIAYQGKLYTYRLTEKRVVGAGEVSYLAGQAGKKSLILQTCWPPGSTAERLLIFADLVEEQGEAI